MPIPACWLLLVVGVALSKVTPWCPKWPKSCVCFCRPGQPPLFWLWPALGCLVMNCYHKLYADIYMGMICAFTSSCQIYSLCSRSRQDLGTDGWVPVCLSQWPSNMFSFLVPNWIHITAPTAHKPSPKGTLVTGVRDTRRAYLAEVQGQWDSDSRGTG